MGETIMYTNLKRNRIGGINGFLESGVESTLTPEEAGLAEAGEWGSISDYAQAEKDKHEQGQAREKMNQEALSYLASTDWYVLRQMDSGEVTPEDVKQLREEARARIV